MMGNKAYWSEEYKSRLILPSALSQKADEIRTKGHTIVTVNGSFDVMHSGHLQILYEASLLGDVLIVALNSDASIKAYKSLTRPIIPLEQRLQMMSSVRFVDYVTWFEETDPRELLKSIKPNIHVNGANYGYDCIEGEIVRSFGGKIHLIEILPGLSTSGIISKIQMLEPQGI